MAPAHMLHGSTVTNMSHCQDFRVSGRILLRLGFIVASANDLAVMDDDGADRDLPCGSGLFCLLKSFKHILSHILFNGIIL